MVGVNRISFGVALDNSPDVGEYTPNSIPLVLGHSHSEFDLRRQLLQYVLMTRDVLYGILKLSNFIHPSPQSTTMFFGPCQKQLQRLVIGVQIKLVC